MIDLKQRQTYIFAYENSNFLNYKINFNQTIRNKYDF